MAIIDIKPYYIDKKLATDVINIRNELEKTIKDLPTNLFELGENKFNRGLASVDTSLVRDSTRFGMEMAYHTAISRLIKLIDTYGFEKVYVAMYQQNLRYMDQEFVPFP